MNVQNAKELTITEGDVRTIHDSNGKQLWGMVAYDTKYAGDATQAATPTPDSPQAINVVKGTQSITLTDGVVSDSFTVGLTGKNLFDSSLLPATWNNANVIIITLKLKPNTKYTMSSDIPLASGSFADIFVYDNTGTGGTASNGVAINKPVTITTLSDGVLKVGYRSNSGTTISRDTYWYQIEEGETATTYVPYFTPIELAKIGTYQDYIYTDGTDWYIHNTHDKSLVDGTYNWNVNHAKTNYTSYNLSGLTFSKMADNNTLPSGFTEQFTGITPNMAYSSDTTMGFAFTTAGVLRINVPNADFADNTAVKTHFGTSPMLVYYALETPTDTKITDTTLIGQLNAIHEWLTRYGYQSSVVGSLPIIISQTNL